MATSCGENKACGKIFYCFYYQADNVGNFCDRKIVKTWPFRRWEVFKWVRKLIHLVLIPSSLETLISLKTSCSLWSSRPSIDLPSGPQPQARCNSPSGPSRNMGNPVSSPALATFPLCTPDSSSVSWLCWLIVLHASPVSRLLYLVFLQAASQALKCSFFPLTCRHLSGHSLHDLPCLPSFLHMGITAVSSSSSWLIGAGA